MNLDPGSLISESSPLLPLLYYSLRADSAADSVPGTLGEAKTSIRKTLLPAGWEWARKVLDPKVF